MADCTCALAHGHACLRASSALSLSSTAPATAEPPVALEAPLTNAALRDQCELATAPLTAGQQVGTLKLSLNDKPVREVPLVVLESVAPSGFFGRAFDAVRLWFK